VRALAPDHDDARHDDDPRHDRDVDPGLAVTSVRTRAPAIPAVADAGHRPVVAVAGGGRRRGRRRWLDAGLAVALVGLAVAAYASVGVPSGPKATPRTAAAAVGVVQTSVSATGNVAAPGDLAVSFTTAGKLVELDVAPGDHVTRGQVLARIDPFTAQGSLDNAQAGLASAQAHLAQLRSGLTPEEQAQVDVADAQAQAQVDSASASLANAQANANQNAINYQTALDQVSATQQSDQNQLADDQNHLADDQSGMAESQNAQDGAQRQVDADQAQVTADQYKQFNDGCSSGGGGGGGGTTPTTSSACPSDAFALQQDQSRLSQDQSALSAAKSSATQLASSATSDTAKLTSDQAKLVQDQNAVTNAGNSQNAGLLKDQQAIQSAEFSLNNALLSQQSTLAANAVKVEPPKIGDVASAEASIQTAQTSVDVAQRAVDDTTLTAPADGTVTTVNGQVGQMVSGGGSAAAGSGSSAGSSSAGSASSSASTSGFLTLTNLTGLEVKAGFSETDAAKLKVGMPASVTLAALPGQGLAAHLFSIDSTATVVSNVVTYNAVLLLDDTVGGIKPGMTAAVTVVTAEKDGVVHVPTAAVRGQGANATVSVLKGGVQTTTPVVVGLRGDDAVEIVSGLAAGDPVVVSSGVTATASGTGTGAGANGGRLTGLGGGGAGGFGGGGRGGAGG